MPARGERDESYAEKQSFISDVMYSPSTSPTPFTTDLDNPPALSAFNSPALVTHYLSDTEAEDAKETRGKAQDPEFSTRVPPPPSCVPTSPPSHPEPELPAPATTTGHTRAPVLTR